MFNHLLMLILLSISIKSSEHLNAPRYNIDLKVKREYNHDSVCLVERVKERVKKSMR